MTTSACPARLPSIRRAVRTLRDLGLSADSSLAPQQITRTAKFKIGRSVACDDGRRRTILDASLRTALNRQFDAYTEFRSRVLRDLEAWWLRDEAGFRAMVTAKTKPNCYNWLQKHYVTGKTAADLGGLASGDARALLNTLSGGLKSFLTRRENVAKAHAKIVADNAAQWSGAVAEIVQEHGLEGTAPPGPPPAVNAERLPPGEFEEYNRWVARARMWGNLVLRQQLVEKGTIDREDAPLPRVLKGYPGFPGSARDSIAAGLRESLAELETAAAAAMRHAPTLWRDVTPGQWSAICERWLWTPRPRDQANAGDADAPRRPRSTRRVVGERLGWLVRHEPDRSPAHHGTEVLAGLERSAVKLRAHLGRFGESDRPTLIKLAHTLNLLAVLALEPLRAAGAHGRYFELDEPRHHAFGRLRGALAQRSDETAAIEITGFSLSSDAPQYKGVLAVRPGSRADRDQWAFLYSTPGCAMKTPPGGDERTLTGWQPSDWLAFTTVGADEEKRLLRTRVWLPDGTKRPPGSAEPYRPALALPLAFGARQGREYLWHRDRPLRDRDDWTPLNARLLRILPAARQGETDEQRARRLERAEFFVTVTFQRDAPPVSEHAAERFLGVDRGEKVPAAWALVDAMGRHVESGLVAETYFEEQRKFNDRKRDAQRQHGGYTGWLRAKERHRAEGLAAEVARTLLGLSARHRAPLVFEMLGKGLATRGGRGVMMSQMQYKRTLHTAANKLAEAGLHRLPSKPGADPYSNGFLRFVGPAYTSATCSQCGQVHDSEFYETLAGTLTEAAPGAWQIALPDGRVHALPAEYTYFLRGKGERRRNTAERLAELLKGKPVAALSKTARQSLVSLLRNRWAAWRPDQATFRCLSCGHTANADVQAALNIARKHLWNAGRKAEAKENTDAARRKAKAEWAAWYRLQLATVWKA